jgi:integrase
MRGHIQERPVNRRTADTSRSFRLFVELPRDIFNGKRRQKTRTVRGTKKDAERALRDLINEVERGAHSHHDRLTVADLLERWLREYARPNVAPKTYVRYEQIVRNDLTPALGGKSLEKLTPGDVQAYYSSRLAEGRLAARTIHHHHRVLKQALKWAVSLELAFRNAADPIRPPRPERSEALTLKASEAKLLEQAARGSTYEGPILLALFTGMRQADVLGLRWGDVDLDEERLSVVNTLQRVRGEIITKEPKSRAGRRAIALSSTLVAALRREHARQAERKLYLGSSWANDRDLVFTSVAGTPLDDSALRRGFKKLLDEAGLPRIRFHDLRHTHATLLLLKGVHPKIVSERLGHANVQITLDTYSHVLPNLQEGAAAAFDEILDEAGGGAATGA